MTKNNEVANKPIRAHVVSVSKDQKTLKVDVARIVQNAMYGKYLHRTTTLLVDAGEVSGIEAGHAVEISPCRKISKRKAWKVVSLVTNK